jgi:23S rRNA pseudouridine2605 synthase
MRLQKFLSRAGVASRRASEQLVREGRVRVDGRVVTEQGVRVDPDRAEVEVDGRVVTLPGPVWVLLHKPPGTICTRHDPGGRRTVYDLLAAEHEGLFHVGRLDMMSEGLLLFTNEGDVAQALLHPSRETPRRYAVLLAPPVPGDLRARLERGVELEDGLARAENVRIGRPRDGRGVRVRLTLREGRNREIRRMMKELGLRVRRLRRTAFGPVELGDLPRGAWRRLTPDETRALRTLMEGTGT